jgi:hypothetical protein
VPNSSQLPKNPRRRSGAYSAMNVAAPPYSPPVEKPCSIRMTSRISGAATPIEEYPGNSPMATVEPDISKMVATRTRCRPILSPNGPKNIPPRGRTKKDTANAAKADNNCAVSLRAGKNTAPTIPAT